MISVESWRCRELYDGCYVAFMTFVIRSHDRRCNYDVLCGPVSAGKIMAKLSFHIKFPVAAWRAIHESIKSRCAIAPELLRSNAGRGRRISSAFAQN